MRRVKQGWQRRRRCATTPGRAHDRLRWTDPPLRSLDVAGRYCVEQRMFEPQGRLGEPGAE